VEFFGWDYFQLGVGALLGRFVGAPATEVGEVSEAVALHVFVGDLDDELGAESFPAQVFAASPAGLCAGHAGAGGFGGPTCPGMVFQGSDAIGLEEGSKLFALGCREAGTGADVLEGAAGVVEAEEQGADEGVGTVLVPAETGDDAVAVALVLDLEHGPFVWCVRAGEGLGHDAVESGAFEAGEPVCGGGVVFGGGG